MRDVYTEAVIPISASPRYRVVKFLLMGALGLSLVLTFFTGILGLLLLAVSGFGLYRHLRRNESEYEYVHTNDVFDVDLVVCNSSRKQLCSVELERVILVAPAESDEVAACGAASVTDYSGNASGERLYAMVYSDAGKTRKLLLRLEEPMRRSLKQWIPGKVR